MSSRVRGSLDSAVSPAADDSDATELALGKRTMLRHAVATLAYRGSKAIRSAPPEFAAFRASDVTRTPLQLIAHLGDLFDWALSLAEGDQRWNVAKPEGEESTTTFSNRP